MIIGLELNFLLKVIIPLEIDFFFYLIPIVLSNFYLSCFSRYYYLHNTTNSCKSSQSDKIKSETLYVSLLILNTEKPITFIF